MNLAGADNGTSAGVPRLGRSVVIGGLGFCLVSLGVFATVAFAERWMYDRLGLPGAYLVWTTLFVLLGGTALHPLAASGRGGWFYLLFSLAFFAYAAGWIGAYFTLRGTAGEWAGSLAGSVLMAVVFAAGYRVPRSAFLLSAVLFVANSTGYFVGSLVNGAIGGTAGMLLWGGIYGLCLGCGLGAVLHLVQTAAAAPAVE